MQDEAMWMTVAMIMLIVVGAVLAVFIAYFVRTAYEVKVEMRGVVERGIRTAEEDGGKRLKAAKLELIEEIHRSRNALVEDGRRRLDDALVTLEKKFAEFESGVRQERVQLSVDFDEMREQLAAFAKRIDDLERAWLLGDGEEIDEVAPSGPPSATIVPAPRQASGGR